MLRKIFARMVGRITVPAGRALANSGVSPNALTVVGFLLVVGAAALVALGQLVLAGFVLLLGSFFDLLDGAAAKSTGKATKAGAFLDSSLDRVSDGLLFGAIAWFFLDIRSDSTGVAFALTALVTGFLVSYLKARAEGLGFECNVGIAERAERIVLPILGLWFDQLVPVMGILIVLSAVTIVQRFVHVWVQAREAGSP